jgi:hypothetical protein
MCSETTSPFVAACRRGLSALLCVLMLLMAVGPTDLPLETGSSHAGRVSIAAANEGSDDPPLGPDTLPCHAAHHVCGKVTPLPPSVVAGLPSETGRQAVPTPVTTDVLVSDVSELPTKPPRA